jgi:hypothetical protein
MKKTRGQKSRVRVPLKGQSLRMLFLRHIYFCITMFATLKALIKYRRFKAAAFDDIVSNICYCLFKEQYS